MVLRLFEILVDQKKWLGLHRKLLYNVKNVFLSAFRTLQHPVWDRMNWSVKFFRLFSLSSSYLYFLKDIPSWLEKPHIWRLCKPPGMQWKQSNVQNWEKKALMLYFASCCCPSWYVKSQEGMKTILALSLEFGCCACDPELIPYAYELDCVWDSRDSGSIVCETQVLPSSVCSVYMECFHQYTSRSALHT